MSQSYSPFPQDPESYSSNGRPIYKKLPLSIFDKVLIGLIGIIVISAWIITIPWNNVSNPLPTHFDDHGKPDVYHKKIFLLWIPVIISAYVLLSEVLCLFLHKINLTGIAITRENAENIYLSNRLILRYNCLCVISSFLLYWIIWMNSVIRRQRNLDRYGMWIGGTAAGCFVLCFVGTTVLVSRARKSD